MKRMIAHLHKHKAKIASFVGDEYGYVTCYDSHGRDVYVYDIPDGVSIEVTNVEDWSLECTWEITTADGWTIHTEASYWPDGSLRFIRGNDRPWHFQTVDSQGRVLLSLDQVDGVASPRELDWSVVWTLDTLLDTFHCLATQYDYTPLPGDAADGKDREKPRTESQYLVRDGNRTLIARTWTKYTRGFEDSYPTLTIQTIRAGSQNAQLISPNNAISSETFFCPDAEGTPLYLRGKPIRSTNEDGITTVYEYTEELDGLRTDIRTFNGNVQALTYHSTLTDFDHGIILSEAERLTADDTVLSSQTHTYDYKNRRRSTTYSDGSFKTNSYSCCRLLSRTDRNGAQTLRSAKTGTDHLYYAEEEISLADLPHSATVLPYPDYTGGHRITQHCLDALGRETNTTIRVAANPGDAVEPDFVSPAGSWCSVETTEYPCGTSDYSIHTDARGVRTVTKRKKYIDRVETTTEVYAPSNEVWTTRTISSEYRNGPSVIEKHKNGTWSRETRATEYSADGTSTETVTFEASDQEDAITRSTTTYDYLGRSISTETPQGTTTTTYIGTTSRIDSTLFESSSDAILTTYGYDTHGDRVTETVKGHTTTIAQSYETREGEVWRTDTQTQTTSKGNLTSSQSSQLTGLSNELRMRTVSTDVDEEITTTTRAFNPETKIQTETSSSTLRSSVTRESKFGRTLSTHTAHGDTRSFFDPMGRVHYSERQMPESTDWIPVTKLVRDGNGDIIESASFISDTETATTSQELDAFGRAISVTDALENTTYTEYDADGKPTHTWGATYPSKFTYDTEGRLTSLSTTQDGTTWKTTTWTYDPETGYPTTKTYADGTTIAYTHTSDGKPLRTTWARGVWKENEYNKRGELTSVDYSDTTPSDSFTYSTDGNLIATSNSKAASVFENTALGIATNETQTVAQHTTTLERGLDAYSRQTSLSVSGEPTQSISYNAENQFSGTQNTDATAICAYTLDGKYAGRTVCATNGITLLIPVVRDSWRRDLITGTETRDAQSNLLWKSAFQYDPLNRLVSRTDNDTDLNTFSYNSCSEVVSASISGVPYIYAYDNIGNQISNVLGNASNTFTANTVNQYSAINNTSLTYDLDGNLLSCGGVTYTWDAANRCTTVSSNDVLLLTNEYDTQSRRVRKITPTATHTYFYDGWNLVLEIIDYPDQTQDRISYVWGMDISGTPQGAGGVGGLYWVKYNNVVYIPTYDSNGNIIAYYHGITGNVVATYQYDSFGHTIAQSGSMASFFRHRFSTKYYDEETGLYYYGYRYYSSAMGRWQNRDPIEEDGGNNLYAFCKNNGLNEVDYLGQKCCIRIWDGIPGHMALRCDNGVYISKYPNKSRKKTLPQPQELKDINQDKKKFTKPPHEYCFSCVDETKIKSWADAHKSGTYFWANKSCIEAVFSALEFAVGEQEKPDCSKGCRPLPLGSYPVVEDRLSRELMDIPSSAITPDMLKLKAERFSKDCQRYECGFRLHPVIPCM